MASSTVADEDVGFDSDLYGLELRWLWGPDDNHRSTLRAFYHSEERDFDAADPNDLSHFGRRDDITRFGISYGKELGAKWKWSLSAYHRENDVSVSSSIFRKNVAALSLAYSFDHEFDNAKRGKE